MAGRAAVPVALLLAAACSGSAGSSSATLTAATRSPSPSLAVDSSTSRPTATVATGTVAPSTAVAGVVPTGFQTVAARVTAADGAVCDVCLWAARTAEQRARGLMGVTDLAGADGMLFRFGAETTSTFWMRDTPMPLSIAFYDGDGTLVSAVDMTPCVDGPADACARYAAAGPYADAVEVALGALPSLLMLPGSRLEVFDEPCPLTG